MAPTEESAAMRTSDQGLELLKEREGCKLQAYLDSVGVPTIGVGHTNGVHMGMTITEDEALGLLREDLQWSEAAIASGVTVPLEQHEFDALVSFVFNVGPRAFAASTLRRMLNAGDRAAAALQFDRWHIPAEITSRRNGEREQFRGARLAARIT
jgi:lysozyme